MLYEIISSDIDEELPLVLGGESQITFNLMQHENW